MLDLAWSVDELARTRLAFSPLWEIVASVRVLARPGEHALHLPWMRQASAALADAEIDVAPLADLVAGRSVPRFFAPAPSSPMPRPADELADLRDVSPRAVRREIESMDPTRPASLTRLHRDPEAGPTGSPASWSGTGRSRWRPCGRACAPCSWATCCTARGCWPPARSTTCSSTSAPAVHWAERALTVARRRIPATGAPHGRGLVLAPSVFVWPRVVSRTHAGRQPVLRYPARGIAGLWETGGTRSSPALRGVLGRSRSALLASLATPADAGDLVRRTGLKPCVVAKHLQLLQAAGLVTVADDGVCSRTLAADAVVTAVDE
ncbi:ArsR family transcriptional regulator [Amycolatopsis sp. FDAARGOS 1241]|uniref:ArsR family transcriptional regulator n=1 Tax=Amycolatopsis sp. FDAARGOS 1241 TaxID=2778070 RepID=UPI0019503A6F|nr:ArsR family transcriptional regulator [Amycolatopsis sp. FDAARGOS 1241]QRP49205.1 ArsR family transcriptional regulator [Amycolatopsis sp. FDAARGOS 1241]